MKIHGFGLAIIFSIIFSGCRIPSNAVEQAGLIERDSQLTCNPADADRCAIRSHLQTLADRTAASGMHYVSLLDIGEDELLVRIHMIRSARESIIMQTFIYDDDDVGRLFFRELLAAACRGVKVRLILDQFGTYMGPDVLASMATAHENIEIKSFSPIMNRGGESTPRQIGTLFLDFKKLNERMHNKLFAVDGRIGMVSGRNILNDYFDYGNGQNFKDLGLLVVGPVVSKMYESFDIYWNHEKSIKVLALPDIAAAALQLDVIGQPDKFENVSGTWFDRLLLAANIYSIIDARPELILYPVDRIEYVADWPVKNQNTPQARQWDSTERIQETILNARRSIIMQTPYLIHEFREIQEFQNFGRKTPKVDIALSTNSLASSDMPYVYAITFKQRHYYLKQLNSRLYEFNPLPKDIYRMMPRHAPFAGTQSEDGAESNGSAAPDQASGNNGPTLCMHAKFFVVDDYVSFVGSHNFDPRSNHFNTENGLIVWDEAVAAELHRIFDRDTAPQNSWVAARHLKIPVLGDISDMIAAFSNSLPVFDLWPFFYSNTYDLKEGEEPISPAHPDFYEHYRNMGAFPNVGLIKQLTVRLSVAFVGLGRGIL